MKSIKYILSVFFFFVVVNVNSQYFVTDYIYTPNNTQVPVLCLTSGDLTAKEKSDYKTYYESYYNYRIIYEGEATYAYNCHAWAWAGRTDIAINAPNEQEYWLDYSYIGGLNNYSEATKVWYGSNDHSANTTSTANYLSSKWGPGPRFKHHYNDSPYGSPASYLKRYNSPSYYISDNITEWGQYKSIRANSSGYATISLSLYTYPLATTPTSYVWSATWTGSCNSWNLSPSNSHAYVDVNLGTTYSGGSLRIVCQVYNGSTRIDTKVYDLSISR